MGTSAFDRARARLSASPFEIARQRRMEQEPLSLRERVLRGSATATAMDPTIGSTGRVMLADVAATPPRVVGGLASLAKRMPLVQAIDAAVTPRRQLSDVVTGNRPAGPLSRAYDAVAGWGKRTADAIEAWGAPENLGQVGAKLLTGVGKYAALGPAGAVVAPLEAAGDERTSAMGLVSKLKDLDPSRGPLFTIGRDVGRMADAAAQTPLGRALGEIAFNEASARAISATARMTGAGAAGVRNLVDETFNPVPDDVVEAGFRGGLPPSGRLSPGRADEFAREIPQPPQRTTDPDFWRLRKYEPEGNPTLLDGPPQGPLTLAQTMARAGRETPVLEQRVTPDPAGTMRGQAILRDELNVDLPTAREVKGADGTMRPLVPEERDAIAHALAVTHQQDAVPWMQPVTADDATVSRLATLRGRDLERATKAAARQTPELAKTVGMVAVPLDKVPRPGEVHALAQRLDGTGHDFTLVRNPEGGAFLLFGNYTGGKVSDQQLLEQVGARLNDSPVFNRLTGGKAEVQPFFLRAQSNLLSAEGTDGHLEALRRIAANDQVPAAQATASELLTVLDRGTGRVRESQGALGRTYAPAGTFDREVAEEVARSGVRPVEGLDAPYDSHGLHPSVLQRGDPSVPLLTKNGRPTGANVAASTSQANVGRDLDRVDQAFARTPNPLESADSYNRWASDIWGPVVPKPPVLPGEMASGSRQTDELLSRLDTPGAAGPARPRARMGEEADAGLAMAERFGKLFTSGEAKPQTSLALFSWGALSPRAAVAPQEGAFLDLWFAKNGESLAPILDRVTRGEFTAADKARVKAIAKAFPQGAFGRQVTSNVNNLAKYLEKMAKPARNAATVTDAVTGKLRLETNAERFHRILSDHGIPDEEMLEQFQRSFAGQGIGIDNKVMSFLGLVSGRKNLIVPDRVQISNQWQFGRDWQGTNLATNAYEKAGYAGLFNGAQGVAMQRAVERGLHPSLGPLYERLGRPLDAGAGRFHWETWVASSDQEVSHGSLDVILGQAEGKAVPRATVSEGQLDKLRYGEWQGYLNGERVAGTRTSDGVLYALAPEQLAELDKLSRKWAPKKFAISKNVGAPFWDAPGFDKAARDAWIREHGLPVPPPSEEAVVKGMEAGSRSSPGAPADLIPTPDGQVADYAIAGGRTFPLTEGRPVRAVRTKAGEVFSERDFPGTETHLDLARKVLESKGLSWRESFRDVFPDHGLSGMLDTDGQYAGQLDFGPKGGWTYMSRPTEERFAIGSTPAFLAAARRVAANPVASAAAGAVVGASVDEEHPWRGAAVGAALAGGASLIARRMSRAGAPLRTSLGNADADQVLATIARGERSVQRPRGLLSPARKVYTMMLDQLYPLRQLGRDLTGGSNALSDEVTRASGWRSSATQWARDHLAPILEANRGQLEEVMTLAKAQRALELLDAGLEKTDIPRDVLERTVAHLSQNPAVADGARQLQDYYRGLLDAKAAEGVLEPMAHAAIAQSSSVYTPFVREFGTGAGGGMGNAGGGRFVNPGTGVRKMDEGLARAATRDPFEQAVLDTFEAHRTIAKQRVSNLLAQVVESNDLAAYPFIRRVANQQAGREGRVVGANINGERRYYEVVDDDLFNAWASFSPKQQNILVRFLSPLKRTLQTGVTLLPDFSVANAERDNVMAALQYRMPVKSMAGSAAAGAAIGAATNDDPGQGALIGAGLGLGVGGIMPTMLRSLDAMRLIVKDDDIYQQFLRDGGGGFGGFYPRNEGDARRLMRELTRTGVQPSDLINPKRWVDGLHFINSTVEQGTRLAAYREALARGETPAAAVTRAADISLDFSKIGSQTGGIAATTAFWNAKAQGWSKLAGMLKNPKTWAAGAAMITAPSVALWALNKDNPEYWERPQWERNLFWLVPRSSGGFYRLAKPFEVGYLFGSIPERILDYAYQKDPEALKASLRDMGMSMAEGSVPLIPTGVQPLVENAFNYDAFRGRPVVSRPDLLPERQFDERTSSAGRLVGEATGTSPQKFDHLVTGYLGNAGKVVLDVTDRVARRMGWDDRPILPDRPTVPVIGDIGRRFVTRDDATSDVESRLFSAWDASDKAYRSVRDMVKDGERPEAVRQFILENAELLRRHDELTKARTAMLDVRKGLRTIAADRTLSRDQKREAQRQLRAVSQTIAERIMRPPENAQDEQP